MKLFNSARKASAFTTFSLIPGAGRTPARSDDGMFNTN
jgi:hypothetical protein